MFKLDWSKPDHHWRRDLSNVDEWDAWDRRRKSQMRWNAGLSFWSKTNTPGARVLLSRHWPHLTCWSWSAWVGTWRRGYDGRRHFSLIASRRHRTIELWVFVAYIRFNWQDSAWMAHPREDAPTLYWKHHLEHAAPAGTA